jgi:hypothetical protein
MLMMEMKLEIQVIMIGKPKRSIRACETQFKLGNSFNKKVMLTKTRLSFLKFVSVIEAFRKCCKLDLILR